MNTADMDTSSFAAAWSVDNPPYVILKWSINHFSLAKAVLKSPCFDVCRTSQWNLLLDPRLTIDEDAFVTIYLKRHPKCEPSRCFLKGEMSVHGPCNELIFDKAFEEIYDPVLNDCVEFRIASVCFPQRKYPTKEGDNYLVRCEMVVSHEIDEPGEPRRLHLEKLSHDLKRLYDERPFADASIATTGGVINAHKAILRTRCPLLQGKHTEVLKENPDIANLLLLFVYCGHPDWMFDSVPLEIFGVLATVAKKWELGELVNVLTPLRMHCSTSIQSEDFQYTWDIKNLSRCDSAMQSSEFFIREGSHTRWQLKIEKNLVHQKVDTYGLYLVKVNSDNTTHNTEVEFRILNCRTKSVITKWFSHKFDRKGQQKYGVSAFFPGSFFRREEFPTKDDPVQVVCVLKILRDTESWVQFKGTLVDIRDRDQYALKYLKTLSKNMGKLCEERMDSDFSLLCTYDQQTVEAHKAILWARSPFFREMSSLRSLSNMQLPCDASTLKDILAYVYTGELPKWSPANSQKIYALSSILKLKMLWEACQSFLLCNITVDNVLEILVMAHEYEDKELEKAAEAFACIPRNAKHILRTARWRHFCNLHIKLALPIYDSLAWAYCSRF